jgi:cystathionine beta-lyase/cystathionine gamma-synthase
MDVYVFEDYTPLPRKYNRNNNVIKTWEERLSRKIKQAKSITKRLEYEMAIMNVKYPFLELPQRRGKALAKMKIPTFMGQIHR